MDKMFYTMPEACQKLGKSEDEVREMVNSGQLQEFRDKDELVFKVEQINLLAGVDEDTGDVVIDLSGASASSSTGLELTDNMDLTGAEDSGAAPAPTPTASSNLGLSAGLGLTGGSGMDLGDSGSAAGLSAFDTGADMAGDDDAGATRVGDGMDDDLTLETVGSGSGLMDLTRESDDTSLGAEILDDAWNSDDEEEFDELANASGLFEAASPDETAVSGAIPASGAPQPAMAGSPMAMFQESYDGAGSGLAAGAAIGGTIALVVLLIILVVELSGTTSALAMMIAGSLWMWTGGIAAIAIIAILAGMFIGKASE